MTLKTKKSLIVAYAILLVTLAIGGAYWVMRNNALLPWVILIFIVLSLSCIFVMTQKIELNQHFITQKCFFYTRQLRIDQIKSIESVSRKDTRGATFTDIEIKSNDDRLLILQQDWYDAGLFAALINELKLRVT